jgi:hypothetical protein
VLASDAFRFAESGLKGNVSFDKLNQSYRVFASVIGAAGVANKPSGV